VYRRVARLLGIHTDEVAELLQYAYPYIVKEDLSDAGGHNPEEVGTI
jgi:hypothetical protein